MHVERLVCRNYPSTSHVDANRENREREFLWQMDRMDAATYYSLSNH